MFKFWLYKFGQFLTNQLSWRGSYKVALWISDAQCFFSFRDRRIVKENLRLILPAADPKKILRLTREVFRNFGRYLNEFSRMPQMANENYLREKVTTKNVERVGKALQRGHGGIILTAHLGNWEFGGVVLGMLGYPVTAIALPHKERPVNNLFNNQRAKMGMNVVPINFAIRRCSELLKNNQLVAIAADRDFTNNGEEIDFLGRKALIPKGAAMFSIRTKAAIIPTFFLRDQQKDKFILFIEEPIFPPQDIDSLNEKEQVLSLMRTCTKIIEDKIRKYPDQWLMFRPFWTPSSV